MKLPYWCNGFTCTAFILILLYVWLKAREARKVIKDILDDIENKDP